MKPFASRYLLLAAFSLVLAACQSKPADTAAEPDAYQQLGQSIASSDLATAENQLSTLQAKAPDDSRLEQYQRQLADAYLQRSQIALQKGDVNAATTALKRARVLMPKAPALIGGVNGAIAQARKDELDKAEAALMQAEAMPRAKVIDPSAKSSVIVIRSSNSAKLRRQLDDIAADTINFDCTVTLEVPRTNDYPWLATLLTRRVKASNANFDFKLTRKINPQHAARVILSPHHP